MTTQEPPSSDVYDLDTPHPPWPDWDALETPEVTPHDRYIVIQIHGYGHHPSGDADFPGLGFMASPGDAAVYTYTNPGPLLFVYDRQTGELHTIEVEESEVDTGM